MTAREADAAAVIDAAWMQQAACRYQPTEWFTDPDSADEEEVQRALDTCTRCPVRRSCLHTALSHPVSADTGIWGGTTEQTRRRLRGGAHTIEPPALTRQPPPTPSTTRSTPRLPAPEITLGRDTHGDYTDATGRVTAFRIHGDPPWMLMIDGRCVARTRTLTEARQRAWTMQPSVPGGNVSPGRPDEPRRHR